MLISLHVKNLALIQGRQKSICRGIEYTEW